MKAIIKVLSLFLIVLSGSVNIAKAGDEPLVEKSKTYSKTYTVSNSDKVSFNNQFGDIKISTWDKNEVKVDVTLTGKGNTEQVATEILNRLSVEDGKNGSGVYFKTKIGNWGNGTKHNNTGFNINYVIYMPATNPLSVENQFGKTTIGDYSGEFTLNQQFGMFTAGKLGNVKKMNIEFSGGSSIGSINGGDIYIKFSRTLINKLEGAVKANFEHCGGVKIGIDNSLKSLTIKNSFNELYLEASNNLSANFDIHTSFAEVDNKTAFPIKEKEEEESHGPKFDHDYTGKSGNGTTPIKIRTEFGEVKIGHSLSFDVNEKEEKKEKKKSRSV